MKYIRTESGIYEVEEWFKSLENDMVYIPNEGLNKILSQADTIKELCDEFVLITDKDEHFIIGHPYKEETDKELFGAIWTDKGLIYVAKMNEEGELELL